MDHTSPFTSKQEACKQKIFYNYTMAVQKIGVHKKVMCVLMGGQPITIVPSQIQKFSSNVVNVRHC